MSISVKPHHPLQELLAQLLFGIEAVTPNERKRMVNFACTEATRWYEKRIGQMKSWIKDMESDIRFESGVCPECNRRIGFDKHKSDCGLFLLINE